MKQHILGYLYCKANFFLQIPLTNELKFHTLIPQTVCNTFLNFIIGQLLYFLAFLENSFFCLIDESTKFIAIHPKIHLFFWFNLSRRVFN